jgi:hypothetical protein
MNNHYKLDIEICFDLEKLFERLDIDFLKENYSLTYQAKIITNTNYPANIQIVIYYKQAEYLFERFSNAFEKDINILDYISTKPSEFKWHIPEIIDFTNSNLVRVEESHYWEYEKKTGCFNS